MSLLILIILVGVVVSIQRRLPKSSCHGDCNQGRTCNCKGKQDGTP